MPFLHVASSLGWIWGHSIAQAWVYSVFPRHVVSAAAREMGKTRNCSSLRSDSTLELEIHIAKELRNRRVWKGDLVGRTYSQQTISEAFRHVPAQQLPL